MKKTTRLSFLIVALLIIFGSSRCRKGEDDLVNTVGCPCNESNLKVVPDSFKNWVWFTDDSWWVYQLKEDPTQFDTVRILNKLKRIDYLPCYFITDVHALPCSQVLFINLLHSNSRYFPFNKDTTKGAVDKINGYFGSEDLLLISYINYEAARNTGNIFSIPSAINQKYTGLCLKNLLDNHEFNGKVFSTVFQTKPCNPTLESPNLIQSVLWAKDVGLLKLELLNSDTIFNAWELVDYNVKIDN